MMHKPQQRKHANHACQFSEDLMLARASGGMQVRRAAQRTRPPPLFAAAICRYRAEKKKKAGAFHCWRRGALAHACLSLAAGLLAACFRWARGSSYVLSLAPIRLPSSGGSRAASPAGPAGAADVAAFLVLFSLRIRSTDTRSSSVSREARARRRLRWRWHCAGSSAGAFSAP